MTQKNKFSIGKLYTVLPGCLLTIRYSHLTNGMEQFHLVTTGSRFTYARPGEVFLLLDTVPSPYEHMAMLKILYKESVFFTLITEDGSVIEPVTDSQ